MLRGYRKRAKPIEKNQYSLDPVFRFATMFCVILYQTVFVESSYQYPF